MSEPGEWPPLPDGLRDFLEGLPQRLDWGLPAAKPTPYDRQWSRLTDYLEKGDWPRITASMLARVWIISFAQAYAQKAGLALKGSPATPAAAGRLQAGTRLELQMGPKLYARASASARSDAASTRDHWIRLRLAKEFGIPIQPLAFAENPGLDSWELSLKFGKVEARRAVFDVGGLLKLSGPDILALLKPPGAEGPFVSPQAQRDLLRFWRYFFRPATPRVKELLNGDPLEGYVSPLGMLASRYLTRISGKLSLSFVLGSIVMGVAMGEPQRACSRKAVSLLLMQLKRQSPGLYRELRSAGCRELLTVVLRRLLEERVSIKRLDTIVSFLVERDPLELVPEVVCEDIRRSLCQTITARYENPSGSLSYIEVDLELLEKAESEGGGGGCAHGSPLEGGGGGCAHGWLDELAGFEMVGLEYGKPLVLIVDAVHRRGFFERTRRLLTDHAVLSWAEVNPRLHLIREGTVGLTGLRLETG